MQAKQPHTPQHWPVQPSPMTKQELTQLFGVSIYVLTRWIKEVGKELGQHKGRYYSAKEIRILMETYGVYVPEEPTHDPKEETMRIYLEKRGIHCMTEEETKKYQQKKKP